MPLIDFYTNGDPGDERLTANTKINLVEEIAQAVRLTAGRGSVGMYGSVVNDRGVPNVPVRLASMDDLNNLYGGKKGWMGDAVSAGTAAKDYSDKGSLAGYNGNLAGLVEGLSAPLVTLTVPNMAIGDDLFDAATFDELPVTFTRGAATFGAFTLRAGTRIKAAGGYTLATLQDCSWTAAETGDKTVRVRQVSPSSVAPVALNTVTVFVDAPEDANVTVSTADVTVPTVVDAADVQKRYAKAFAASLSYFLGTIAEIVACDRTEAAIVDDLFAHAESASAQGHFRLAVGAPPLGTAATDAEGSGTDGVGRATLKRSYGAVVHQGWSRQASWDSPNLNVENGYEVEVPAALSFAFNAALFRPEESPANFTPNLTNYKITGIEILSPAADRRLHEDAGIIQPILEFSSVGLNASLVPTFHASPLADASMEFYTRRAAFFLYRNYIAIAQPYHKRLAALTTREEFTDAIDDFLDGLMRAGRIGGYNPTTHTWDAALKHMKLRTTVLELGNIDKLTIYSTYGGDVEVSRTLEAA